MFPHEAHHAESLTVASPTDMLFDAHQVLLPIETANLRRKALDVKAALGTGLRLGELLSLKPESFALSDGAPGGSLTRMVQTKIIAPKCAKAQVPVE